MADEWVTEDRVPQPRWNWAAGLELFSSWTAVDGNEVPPSPPLPGMPGIDVAVGDEVGEHGTLYSSFLAMHALNEFTTEKG